MAIQSGGATAPGTSELVVKKRVRVRCSVEQAFRTFTEGIDAWWPLATHSLGDERARTAVFEGGVGGRIYERWDDGSEREWGRVTDWSPPARVCFSWRPNPEAAAPTEVEVRFIAGGDATLVELEHRGWERLGERARKAHESYDSPGGWTLVIGCYAEAADEQ